MKHSHDRRSTGASFALAALLLFVAGSLSVHAAGRTEESDFLEVENAGNWEYTIDVTDREPGKYNILVRARDAAGNVSLGGPYNIFIDPESDLPTTTISYPAAGDAVGERLLVVGTASDDDAVSYVEVQIADGPFVRADGAAYWSALVPVASLDDGHYTIRARAVDINGVEGEPIEVPVRLDTTRPAVLPTSHESGVLVSRRTTIEATVDDANGIASLTLIAGDDRSELSLRGRGDGPRTFSFTIDPRALPDGAAVWWLEGVDGTGAVGTTPFLFFVDTSPPQLELLYPAADDRVDRQLRLVGRVSDGVGVAGLAYELSTGEQGEITVTPGDPYWSLSLDLPAGARGNLRVDLTVTDLAGNARTERLRFELDTDGDAPQLSLLVPAEGSTVEGPYLAGHIDDDDGGAAAVVYLLDREAEVRVDLAAGGTDGYLIPLDGLAPGQHEVRVRAVDRFGTEGPEVRRVFTVTNAPSPVRIDEVVRGESAEAYAPGFAVAANERVSLRGSLADRSSGSRLTWTIGGSTGTTTTGADGTFTVALPRSDAGGPVPIELVTQNAVGTAGRTIGFYVQLPPAAEDGTVPELDDLVGRGLYASSAPGGDAAILLAPGDELSFRAVGGAPSNAALTPEVDFLATRTEGNLVVVRATAGGSVDRLIVSADVGGSRASTEPIALRTELAAPTIDVPTELVGRRLAELGEVGVAANDPSGLSRVTVAALPAATDPTSAAPANAAEARLPPAEGPAFLRIDATDASGAVATLFVPIVVDRTAPDIRVVSPPAGEPSNGTITAHAILSEPGSTTSIVAGPDSKPVAVDRLVSHEFSVGGNAEGLALTLTDAAGNTATRRVAVLADPVTDLPMLQLQVPPEGGLVQDEFTLSGVLLDDDAPQSVTYSIDDAASVTTNTDGTFSIPVPMDGLADGDHTVTVFGTDIAGATSEPVTRRVAISRSVPETRVLEPALDAYLRSHVTISGASSDPNGIREVSVSSDNGSSYQRATGRESWSYALDTTLLDDGTHSVLVRAVDGAGEASLLSTTINVDNTPPVLELAEPHDGVTVSGEFLIDGLGDDGSLEQVRLVAQALGGDGDASEPGGRPIELVAFDSPGPFAYVVDASSLTPGWYNLRVEAVDRAGNVSHVSRNLLVEPVEAADEPTMLLPAHGDAVAHRFTVTVASDPAAGPVTVLANGAPIGVIPVARPGSGPAEPSGDGAQDDERAAGPVPIGPNGVGSLTIEPGTIPAGTVELSLRTQAPPSGSDAEGRQGVLGAVHTIELAEEGPWISVDAPGFLAFVRDRPYVRGRAGYELALPEPDPEASDRDARRARQEILAAHEVEYVEVSLDNGRTFSRARGADEWEFRLETTTLPDGRHNLVLRARFANGETAVTRHSLVVDESVPAVRLLDPAERDTFDETVRIVGVTTDSNPLADVGVVLREGDKSRYELPSFIQGLYLDAHVLGATVWDAGAGLTFFDNNVRLQGQIGMTPRSEPGRPPQRFSGLVLGTKLLANVASFPASFFLGPDYRWLSAALAVGANFSYFTMSEDSIEFTDEGLVLAGMVAQLEFPIVTLEDLSMFDTYSVYTEAQLWFISSDVEAGTAFRMAFGLRVNVF